MSKLRKIVVVLAAIVTSTSIFLGVSKWSADTAPVLLRFAESHPSVLQSGTLFLILFSLSILIMLVIRRHRS
jgi:hypothetical protein